MVYMCGVRAETLYYIHHSSFLVFVYFLPLCFLIIFYFLIIYAIRRSVQYPITVIVLL